MTARRLAHIGAVLAAVVALGAPAAPALAGGWSLDLVPQSEAVVGRPLVIQAIGTMPPESVLFPFWFSLDAIPAAVSTTCPADRWMGAVMASNGDGSWIVFIQGEHPDLAGNFTIPVTVTPTAPGTVLLCAYSDDGGGATMAVGQLILDIKPAPSSPGGGASSAASPAGGASSPPSPQVYAAQHIRSCRALLARRAARSCVRDIVRKANARCRRLPSGRARCLRAVRRVATRGG